MSYNSDIQDNNLQLQAILETINSLPEQTEVPQLTVTAPTGSTVTATQGGVTMQTTEESGTWLFTLPEFGEWTVTATKDGESASDTVDVQQDYETTLSYKPTASITPTSGVTYTDGISTLTAEKMSLYGESISNNANITNTTSEVYIDDGASHYKVSVGDSINLTVSGASYEFVILGFNHDELTMATSYGAETVTGKAGFTLQTLCTTGFVQLNTAATNVGGWNGCAFRTTLQGTIKNSMDSAWQSAIKTVKKLASAGNQSATITTSNDTLFLLSEIEVFGSAAYSVSGEGAQYAWYAAGNTKIKKSLDNQSRAWWLRSPVNSNSTSFSSVNTAGSIYVDTAYQWKDGTVALCI